MAIPTVDQVWADFDANGKVKEPAKQEIRRLLNLIMALAQAAGSGAKLYPTKAAMDADLSQPDGTVGMIYADPVDANNFPTLWYWNDAGNVWVMGVDRLAALATALATLLPDNGYVNTSAGAVDRDGIAILWAATDDSWKAPLLTNVNGVTAAGDVEIINVPGEPGVLFVDEDYRAYARSPDYPDQSIPIIGGAPSAVVPNYGSGYIADYMLLLSYGQSLSIGAISGANTSSGTPVVVSSAQPYLNLKFSTGPRYTGSESLAALAALTEVASGTNGETPCSGAANEIVRRVEVQTGIAAVDQGGVFVAAAAGQGTQTVAQLSPGTANYDNRIPVLIQNGYSRAQASGVSYGVPAMLWTQGEQDQALQTTRSAYKTALKALKDQFIADVFSNVPGQSFRPVMITYQLASHLRYYSRPTPPNGLPTPEIALALREAAAEDDDIFCVTPIYWGDYYDGDYVHMTAESYLMLGKYYGRAMEKIMRARGAGLDIPPLAVDLESIVWQGTVADLTFSVPYGRLQWETTWVSEIANKGFDLFEPDGDLLDTITSVEIRGANRVRLRFSSAPPSGTILRYGAGRPGVQTLTGRTIGPRGNLADTEGDIDYYIDGNGVLRKLHNYCLIFETAKP